MSGRDEEATTSTATRGGSYFPAPDELDPNVAINLNSLRDAPPDGKPLYSYATLIRYVWLFSLSSQNSNHYVFGSTGTPSRVPPRADCY
jgi:hypothetical protein